MNDLSWFLYLAGTLPQLSTAVAFLTFILMLVFGVVFIIFIGCKGSGSYTDRRVSWSLRPYRHLWAVMLVIYLCSFLVPEKETFYAIAASEMGEEVLNSSVGNKARQALESWLDEQINEETVTEKKED